MTHKYGIEIPTSIDHAMEVDRKNGNTIWRDALVLEMFNAGVAFEIVEEDQSAPLGWKKASGHLIGMSRWTSPGKQGGSWMDTKHRTQSDPLSLAWFHVRVFE